MKKELKTQICLIDELPLPCQHIQNACICMK
jgi:hypothetical protein